jgi:hypothetical protein
VGAERVAGVRAGVERVAVIRLPDLR